MSGVELGRVRRAAIVALEDAERAQVLLGCWVDEIRQQVERRTGIGADDPAAWADPEYGAALDLMGPAWQMVKAARELREALDAWTGQPS